MIRQVNGRYLGYICAAVNEKAEAHYSAEVDEMNETLCGWFGFGLVYLQDLHRDDRAAWESLVATYQAERKQAMIRYARQVERQAQRRAATAVLAIAAVFVLAALVVTAAIWWPVGKP